MSYGAWTRARLAESYELYLRSIPNATYAPFQTRERRHRHPRREGAIHADKRAAASLAGAANYQLPLLLSLRTSRGSTEVYAYAHGAGECEPKPLQAVYLACFQGFVIIFLAVPLAGGLYYICHAARPDVT